MSCRSPREPDESVTDHNGRDLGDESRATAVREPGAGSSPRVDQVNWAALSKPDKLARSCLRAR